MLLDSGNLLIGRVSGAVGALERVEVETRFCFGITDTPYEVEVEGAERITVGPDIVRFHNVGDRIWTRTDEVVHSRWIILSDDLVASIFPGRDGSQVFPKSFMRPNVQWLARLRTLFRRVENGHSDGFDADEQVCELLSSIASHSELRRWPTTDRELRLVKEADAAVVELLGQLGRLSDLARELGVSPSYLTRTYKKVTGGTLHSKLVRVRLAAALDRIADGADDLTQLALDLGFSSHSHFSYEFRSHLGVPPSAYRSCGQIGVALKRPLEQSVIS